MFYYSSNSVQDVGRGPAAVFSQF